jgi:hypothetical protein
MPVLSNKPQIEDLLQPSGDAVLDEAHLCDIYGALGTLRVSRVAPAAHH